MRPVATTTKLPLVIEPEPAEGRSPDLEGLLAWIGAWRDWLESTLEQAGAILFRGFDLTASAEFERVVRHIRPELASYVEGPSQRKKITDKVYNSTYYPARFDITHHNELSYAHRPPERIFFFCETPPSTGGATPLLDGRRLLAAMPRELREPFERHGIRYVKNMHGGKGFGKSWQDHFETDDRAIVERYLREGGVRFEWLDNGTLRTSQVRPATARHPRTGAEVWFNQATLWHVTDRGEEGQTLLRRLGEANLPTHVFYGDGSPIPNEVMDRIRALSWELSAEFPWQRGDLVVVDNILVLHGRRAYTGPRNILVAMS
jgi:alpha-ketoglutarate-dependent taurine dioxygenase